jgi:hypothetical protein
MKRREVERLGVRVVGEDSTRVRELWPHFGTRTHFWSHVDTDELREAEANFAGSLPLQRIATVDEGASTYLHLMTNAYITGQVVAVDGGVMLQK